MFVLEDDKIKEVHLGPSGEGSEVSPAQFSVKGRNRNPDCYFFSLFNILQFLHNTQTAQFLCRNASNKYRDSCTVNHFARQQCIKIQAGHVFALLSDNFPNIRLLRFVVMSQSALFKRRAFIF